MKKIINSDKKNKIFKLLLGLLIVPILLLTWYAASYGYWWLMAWQGLDYSSKVQSEFNSLPSDILLKKTWSLDPLSPFPKMAFYELARRQDARVIPILINSLDSRRDDVRYVAINCLGEFQDKRTIDALMNIIDNGEGHRDYIRALIALSKLKYDSAFSYVIKLAKKDEPIPGIINMFEDFGKPEGIPLLLERRNKIKDDGSIGVRIDIESYDEAIAHLQSIQKEQEQQNKEKSPPTPIN
ncbi:MAG: HEAT repeat domain-containing protein [bacterium]